MKKTLRGIARHARSTLAAIAIGALVSANTACVTVGKTFDTTHAGEVRTGQTRGEIVRWFGEPAWGNKLSLLDSPRGCVKRYRYAFADDVGSHVLWIDFDERDLVCNSVYSTGPS